MKNVRKCMCALLSIGIMFSFFPENSYSMNNGNVNDVKTRYIDDIAPGEKFDSGVYLVREDCEVIQNEPGGNGIEINGRVKFIIGDNCSVKIKAGDGKGTVGGGAGVYVPEGSEFILDGKGKFEVKGGNGEPGSDGRDGVSGKHESSGHWYTYDKMFIGDSGAGGAGGGGAGAGIGTPGGKGGFGGAGVLGNKYRTSWWDIYTKGENGKDGEPGGGTEAAGTFVLWGNLETNIKGGIVLDSKRPAGKYGENATYRDFLETCFNAAGGTGGGAGGSGFDGACVGSGGTGGSGGGSGGVGCYTDVGENNSILGGGGAGGFGKFCGAGGHTWGRDESGGGREIYAPKDGEVCIGGKGAELFWKGEKKCGGGCGGNCKKSSESGAGGKFYFDIAKKGTTFLRDDKNAFDGKEALGIEFIKESDCKVEAQGSIVDATFPYTGEEVKPRICVLDKRTNKIIPEKSYEVFYFDNKEVGRAEMTIHGIEFEQENAPIMVSDKKYDKSGSVIFPFDIRYETKLSGINVKSKKYNGKAVKPTGKLKIMYEGKNIAKKISKKDISFNYYNLTDFDEEKMDKAPKGVGEYKLVVYVKNAKYVGVLDNIRFKITSAE